MREWTLTGTGTRHNLPEQGAAIVSFTESVAADRSQESISDDIVKLDADSAGSSRDSGRFADQERSTRRPGNCDLDAGTEFLIAHPGRTV